MQQIVLSCQFLSVTNEDIKEGIKTNSLFNTGSSHSKCWGKKRTGTSRQEAWSGFQTWLGEKEQQRTKLHCYISKMGESVLKASETSPKDKALQIFIISGMLKGILESRDKWSSTHCKIKISNQCVQILWSPRKLRTNQAGLTSGVSSLCVSVQKKILLEMFLQNLRQINGQSICSHGHHEDKLGVLRNLCRFRDGSLDWLPLIYSM